MTSAAIILAAGSSSRMGQPKQLLDIEGKKLLVITIRAVLDSCINAVVVLGADETIFRKLLNGIPVDIVVNANWNNGIGSSIKTGLHHLTTRNTNLKSVLIFVCDQPLLSANHIRGLVTRYQSSGKPIIASRYSNTPGVPALFDAAYFPNLMSLPDDTGAKKIIINNPTDVSEVDFPDGQFDLDTMEDYQNFINRPKIIE